MSEEPNEGAPGHEIPHGPPPGEGTASDPADEPNEGAPGHEPEPHEAP